MNFVIIGNGAAGVSAASSIHKIMPDAGIIIITDEKYNHYSRPRVIDLLSGEVSPDKIIIKNNEWYDSNNISLISDKKIISINTESKSVQSSDGTDYIYDKLILATGAHSFLPPIKGSEDEGVFTLRTIDDAEKLIKYSEGKTDALIIGGGLLGLETAYSLLAQRLQVKVIEVFDYLLPRQLDEECSEFFRHMLERKGLQFITGKKTNQIRRSSDRLITLFEDESSVESDLIVFSAGIRCNLDLAKSAKIETDKGIKINKFMETNIKDIYACGDVAEFNGNIYGIWPAATEQGKICGSNAAGEKVEYTGSIPATKLKAAGIDMASVGIITPDEETNAAIFNTDDTLKKVFMKNDHVIGGILIGDTKSYNKLQKFIKESTKFKKCRDVLKEL